MTIKHLIASFLLITIVYSCAKDEPEAIDSKALICASDRYLKPIFDGSEVVTVQFGSNINTSGLKQDLMMDVYLPKGDTLSKRPTIVLAFGGSFIAGDRKQLSELAKELARLGFVSACIDYRLLSFSQWPIDSIKGLDIAIKAAGDMKAAVRHLRRDAATTNTFRIDPDMIIVGGVSAGAITALQAAYFDASDNTEAHIKSAIDRNGGVEGSSGDAQNLTYSSKVQGVINMSGAIYRPNFIDTGEPPVVSIHGDKDDVVPFKYDFARPLGIPIIPLYGSFEIQKHTQQIGLSSQLITVKDGGHDNIYTDPKFAVDFEKFKVTAYQFYKDIICK